MLAETSRLNAETKKIGAETSRINGEIKAHPWHSTPLVILVLIWASFGFSATIAVAAMMTVLCH